MNVSLIDIRNRRTVCQHIDSITKETEVFSSIFSSISEIYIKFWAFWKQDDSQNFFVSEIKDFEKRGEINV